MSTFAERYSKILSDNHLKPVDAIKKTGLSKDIIYNVTSEKTAKKYDEIENLFKVCETPEQIIELATGKHLPQESQNTLTPDQMKQTQAEVLQTIRELTATVRELSEEVRQLREVVGHQVRLRQKVPDDH